MQSIDFRPPSAPSLDEQREALQKGLGRAYQWALQGNLEDSPFLEACLHDQRFDMQCEDLRSEWLWNLMQIAENKKRFHAPIFNALTTLPHECDASQLCKLAFFYANEGDKHFRSKLYEIVEEKPIPDLTCLGEEELLDLEGEKAFLFIARVRGKRLRTEKWDWDASWVLEKAIKQLGEEHVSNVLQTTTDADLRRFFEHWRESRIKKRKKDGPLTCQHRVKISSVEEVFDAATEKWNNYLLQRWGINATETELQEIVDALWETVDPNTVANLLRVFSRRALPQFDQRLIEMCKDANDDIRSCAFVALANNTHPTVRKFALEELEKEATWQTVSLFTENFESGDEKRILDAIIIPEDDCEQHWLFSTIIDILEKNPHADCYQLGITTYALTPCEICRFNVTKMLQKQDAAPPWMIEECRHDASKDIRDLFS